jgi:pimeloyl-ACP methyl ester carboxylesterase
MVQGHGMNIEESYLNANNIRLHAVQAGPRDGVPVILLHGFPEFWYGWRKQIPALAQAGCRVIAPDQRGYNLSDKPAGIKAYHWQALVEDVTGLMDALAYEKVHLVGHDWGGVVAWLLAISRPERLHSLSILNAPHPAVMSKSLKRDLSQIRRSWYAMLFQLPWLPEAGMRSGDWRGATRALRGSGKLHTFPNEEIAEYKKAWAQPGAVTAMINWYRAAFWFRPRMKQGGRVRIRTLMLWGARDVALGRRLAGASIDTCEDGRLLLFPDATHWVQHDEAEQVNQDLLDFIFDKGTEPGHDPHGSNILM